MAVTQLVQMLHEFERKAADRSPASFNLQGFLAGMMRGRSQSNSFKH